MPLKGGVKQRLKRPHIPDAPPDAVDEEEAGTKKARTFATGGRKRASSMGDFLSSMYLIGNVHQPLEWESLISHCKSVNAGMGRGPRPSGRRFI